MTRAIDERSDTGPRRGDHSVRGSPAVSPAGHGPGSAARESSLIAHLGRFCGELRRRDVPLSLGDEIDAARALQLIDIADIDEVHTALRVALRIGPRHATLFNLLFNRMWRRAGRPGGATPPPPPPDAKDPPGFEVRTGISPLAAPPQAPEHERGDTPGYSPDAVLRRKAFDQCTDEDLIAMHRLLERLIARLATRRSRRLVPSAKRGVVDLRRSLRRTLATGGEPVTLQRRARAIDLPHLVLLCDTSGSMDAHSRFLLTFMLSLRRIARNSEAFAFNTRLTRLTPWLTPGNVLGTLERLASQVDDWSGGTRIGACLMEFVDRWAHTVIRSDTVVIILSDGLDRGDTETLHEAMLHIRRRARRVIWLNPLMGDPRYRPEAKGMKAALEYIDHLVPAHDLASLEALLPLLAA